MIQSLVAIRDLYLRDLDRLEKEIDSYKNEESLWVLDGEISNTAGNLCLHLCGNLQHFFGHMMAGSKYARQRDDEFGLKDVPRNELKGLIEKSREAVVLGLEKMSEEKLEEDFPNEVFGYPMTYRYFITSLYGHLNYHLGQINYHRRVLATG